MTGFGTLTRRRRAVWTAATATTATLVLAACGVTPPTPPDDDAALATMKAAAHIAPCVSGQTADGGLPAYTLPCLGGGTPVELATLKGPLLINFWSPACGPCREEMPALETFYEKYGGQLPMLGIDTTNPVPRIALQTAIQRGVTYPMADDPRGTLRNVEPVAFRSLPMTFLLTADGQVRFVSAVGMTDEAEVERRVSAALGAPLRGTARSGS